MSQSAIDAQVHESLDIHGDFPSEIAFNPVLFIYDFPNTGSLLPCQVIRIGIPIDTRLGENFLGGCPSYAVNIGEGHLHPLSFRKINA
jgi:hypothetical protein